jgi:L-ascorbate metabolism protein UlaG (beta-lactamase superfamily)
VAGQAPSSGGVAAEPDGPARLAVTWAGHSTALIEVDGVRLLTDPVLRDRLGPLARIATPVAHGLAEDIDAVLVSHLHADHTDLRSLRRVGRAVPVIAPPGAARWLARNGMRDVRELRAGEQTSIGPVQLSTTPATHDGRRWPLGPHADAVGFVARGSLSCYFAGDTDLFDGMAEIAGPIDLALLPVWGWGPTLGPGHLDPTRAANAAALISPRVAVPIHWGTFTLRWPRGRATDPELPARSFAALVARDSPEVQVRVLAPGERTEVSRARTAGG